MPLASGPLMFEIEALTSVKLLADNVPVTGSPKVILPLSLFALVTLPALILSEITAAGGVLSALKEMVLDGVKLFPAVSVIPEAMISTETFPSVIGVSVNE